jgi:twitching motility protein PilT
MGQQKFGMQTFNQALCALFQRKLISLDEALNRSSDPEELKNMMGGSTGGAPRGPGGSTPAARGG